MSFHNETHVKRTRRARRCNWCREWIDYGEPSVAVAGNYDGDFYSARYHPECSAAISRWSKREGWREPLPDYPMNRGGIEELGEPETEPVDKPVTNAETERTVVTCVYCGHEYPDGTPTAKAESLTAHVKVCDKHPMKRAIDALAGLVGSRDKAELKGMRDQLHLFQIRPSERAPMVDAINVLLETLP